MQIRSATPSKVALSLVFTTTSITEMINTSHAELYWRNRETSVLCSAHGNDISTWSRFPRRTMIWPPILHTHEGYGYWESRCIRNMSPGSIWRCHLTSIGNLLVKIELSSDRQIHTMGFPILVSYHSYIESAPTISIDVVFVKFHRVIPTSL